MWGVNKDGEKNISDCRYLENAQELFMVHVCRYQWEVNDRECDSGMVSPLSDITNNGAEFQTTYLCHMRKKDFPFRWLYLCRSVMCVIAAVGSIANATWNADNPVFRPLFSLRLTICVHNSECCNKQSLASTKWGQVHPIDKLSNMFFSYMLHLAAQSRSAVTSGAVVVFVCEVSYQPAH